MGKRPSSIRVVSYNIHKGFDLGNREFVLDKIREAIRSVDADLVLLQEVLGDHAHKTRQISEWPNSVQFEYLADEIWPHFAYGKNSIYTEGHHGNAILSRYPIVRSENIDISAHRVEKRGLLHAEIEIPGYESHFHAVCLHLGLLESWRREQVSMLAQRIEKVVPRESTIVVGGDFNDWRGRATGALIERLEMKEAFQTLHGEHARTYPSVMPAFKLDRIYYRRAEPVKAQRLDGRPWSELSDHTPLVADLILD